MEVAIFMHKNTSPALDREALLNQIKAELVMQKKSESAQIQRESNASLNEQYEGCVISDIETDLKFDGLSIDYRNILNKYQLIAATRMNGNYLLMAGPGCGKTTTATHRVAYLIENGVEPEKILMLTFTRNAANNMKEKLRSLIGSEKAKRVHITTFHGLCYRHFKEFNKIIDYNNGFAVIDEMKASKILKTFIIEGFEDIDVQGLTVGEIVKLYKHARLSKCGVKQYFLNYQDPRIRKKTESLVKIWQIFEEYKRDQGYMDFDDLIEQYLQKLKADEKFRSKVMGKYNYIVVDEYQDTSWRQDMILHEFANAEMNMMLIGDDCQSIYSFRGASNEKFKQLKEDFPALKVIVLSENYRSQQPIINFFNQISKSFKNGFYKELKSRKQEGSKPELVYVASAQEEAHIIADKLEEYYQVNGTFQGSAVLYRANHHVSLIEMELVHRRIPYIKPSGNRFERSEEYQAMVDLLMVARNPHDKLVLQRLLLKVEGIGPNKCLQILEQIQYNKQLEYSSGLDRSCSENVQKLVSKINEAHIQESIEEALVAIFDAFSLLFKASNLKNEEFRRIIGYFKSLFDECTSISDLISKMSVETDLKSKFDSERTGDVVLSTIHKAKGLEWDHVFIVNMTEREFPSVKSSITAEGLEEEKRLFYVAASRATQNLTITIPMRSRFVGASRFLLDIGETYYTEIRLDEGQQVRKP